MELNRRKNRYPSEFLACKYKYNINYKCIFTVNEIISFYKDDHSRVILESKCAEEGDYINANFIPVGSFSILEQLYFLYYAVL